MSDKNDNLFNYEVDTKCRCCLNNEGWRFMWRGYEHGDSKEVYGEMLMECFALSWHVNQEEMICESCVRRVRDAFSLKIEILAVQELLQENVFKININKEAQDNEVKEPYCQYDSDDMVKEDSMEFDSVGFVESDQEEGSCNELPERPRKKKRPMDKKLYRSYSTEAMRNAKEAVKRGEMSMAKAAARYCIPLKTLANKLAANGNHEKDEERDEIHEKNIKLYEEIKTIILYTNALPFKTKTTKYYCAYCSTDGPFFEDPDKLRKHTRSMHSKELAQRVQAIMRPAWLNEILKIDITDLMCTVCEVPLDDWNKMLIHFAEQHDIQFDEAYNRVIPYSLTNNLKCVLCGESFLNFGQLDAHMNAHYCNYICYECGDTFLANSRLEKHLKVHKVGKFPCDQCDKVFTLDLYRSKHINLVHKQLCKVKCLYCPEKFLGTLIRHQHVLQEHPHKIKVLACGQCNKKFTWKPYYINHIKNAHSKYKCATCDRVFSNKLELKNHITKSKHSVR